MSDKKPDAGAFSCPIPVSRFSTIQLSHGAGGRLSADLINSLFVEIFDNPALKKQDDQALLEIGGLKLSFTTDSFVVDPIFFPGGDIGDLAVNGTVNDLCMNGARPLYLSAGFIIEEGLPLDQLDQIVRSMKRAADIAGVQIVTGDTKVVNKGKGDKLFINTAGLGLIEHPYIISAGNLRVGDNVILSGSIADHGIAILSKRQELNFKTEIESDTAALNHLVAAMLEAGGEGIHAMRDPTRGGVAATLNEFARTSKVGTKIRQDRIPVKEPVAGACELLGLDPLLVANEGKLVAVVANEFVERVLTAMHAHPLGKDACVIGEVIVEQPGLVSMVTGIGGSRIVDLPEGEQLPRIC
ncbi:MAG TPA: hydrogenase expression/formation protein HypE [candidate division Zixibacteria bacterium]|nr:hydrogenase expression/formation protein HypE [candidate division Zixibacteria bacterium]